MSVGTVEEIDEAPTEIMGRGNIYSMIAGALLVVQHNIILT